MQRPLASTYSARTITRAASAHELLHHRVAEAAAAWPESLAVQCGDATIRYAELEAAATRVARRLRALGVGAERRVAIIADRSVDMVVAALGILKAGCAYVPLDPSNPQERLEFLLTDAAVAAVVIHERHRPLVPSIYPIVLSLDGDRELIARESTEPLPDLVTPDALAYVIYTSGSTGKPKGVQIEHRNVLAFLDGLAPRIPFRPDDVHAAVASLSFDMSGLDLFAPLTSAATLLLVPREIIPQPQAVLAYLAEHGATSFQATPTAWRMLVEAGWTGTPALRVLTGGEALSQSLADKLTAAGSEVWNLYGPTEATIYVCVASLSPGDPVTLGRPLEGTTLHVLDERGAPVTPGEEGLLFLGGPQVARGYLNRPELTAQRFVPNAFSTEPGARLYNTGDVVRQGPDGSLEYLGRRDDQVKVRGYRIELGEIEAVLLRHERVVSAAVVVHRKSLDDDPRLVAYVTVRAAQRRRGPRKSVYVPVVTWLRRFIADGLPSHMVPERVVILSEMPVTIAGKIDRLALAAMPLQQVIPEFVRSAPIVEPRSEMERRLTEIFERVLEIRPISVTDNFFDLGATSVAAARLFSEIEHTIGGNLPLAPLFTAPTVERLAQLMEGGRVTPAPRRRFTSLVTIQAYGQRPPIFCVHGGVGTILHFGRLARYLGTDQPFYGLQMRGLEGDRPLHTNVGAMARHYVAEIAAFQPHGPYVLAGYCFGAIIAEEMARLFAANGERVSLLMSFNGPTPAYIQRKAERRAARVSTLPPPRDLMDAILRPAKRLWWSRWRLRSGFARERRWLRQRGLLEWARVVSAGGGVLKDGVREQAIYAITHHIEMTHAAKPWTGSMLVAQSASMFPEDGIGWRDVEGIDVETHMSTTWADDQRLLLAEPAVVWLADVVRHAIDRVAAAR